MEIVWYGHSCFRLSERGLSSVIADPFDYRAAGYEPLKLKAEIVTTSHDTPGHSYISAVKGYRQVITGPGEYEIGGVFITGVQTNTQAKRGVNGQRNTLYVFDFEGVTIAHLGDLDRVPSQAEIEALGNVHVALVPVGGGGGLTAAKAAEVIALLEPGFVIPMHYATKASTTKLAPLSKFLKEMGLGDLAAQPSLKVTRTSVPDETRVVVLSYEH